MRSFALNGPAIRRAARVAVLLTLSPLPGSGFPGGGTSFRQRFATIYRRLGVIKRQKGWRPEKDKPLLDALERLTTQEIERLLNARPVPSPTRLTTTLDDDLVEAMFHQTFEDVRGYAPPGATNFVSALSLRTHGTQLYVVAFRLLDDGMCRDVIEGFRGEEGRFHLVAATGSELDDHSVHLVQLRSFHDGQIWFLAHGVRLGSSHLLFEGIQYEFDGRSFRRLWTQPDIAQGTVVLRRGVVILTYQDIQRWEAMTPPYFVRRQYLQTRSGLKLVSSEGIRAP